MGGGRIEARFRSSFQSPSFLGFHHPMGGGRIEATSPGTVSTWPRAVSTTPWVVAELKPWLSGWRRRKRVGFHHPMGGGRIEACHRQTSRPATRSVSTTPWVVAELKPAVVPRGDL